MQAHLKGMRWEPEYVHVPFGTPPDDYSRPDILLWIYHSILYAKECYLRTPITKSYSEVVRDAVDRCIYIATYGRKDGITFGSFDNDIFYQPTTNSTATVTTPIVYDDQCAYEIDFGIASNETIQKSSNQHLHGSHIPID